MPILYHLISVGVIAIVLSLAVAILDLVLSKSRKKYTRLIIIFRFISIWGIGFIIAIIAVNITLRQIQATIAVPLIQNAIVQQCPSVSGISVTSEGFHVADTYEWSSEDKSVSCYFNHKEWICTCS